MKLSKIISFLEEFAPPAYQEAYDNAGLITGNPDMEITSAMVCLDSTEEVIEEAIKTRCNLVIAHHPIVFAGLKKINGKNYVERAVIKAIKKDIAIYAIHTNLDNVQHGVSMRMAEELGLVNCRVLSSKPGLLGKLITFCPAAKAGEVRQALFRSGAGNIGNYDECSFNSEGTGTFRASDAANPWVGKKNEQHREKEVKIEVIYPLHAERSLVQALRKAHPYEEPAFDLVPLRNTNTQVGAGIVGELKKSQDERLFLNHVKQVFSTGCIRHSPLLGKKIKRVALCGGSGFFLLPDAIRAEADVFLTADIKYHQFFDADNKIVMADIGHYESEQFTLPLIAGALNKKFPKFAVRFPKRNTNPVNYL